MCCLGGGLIRLRNHYHSSILESGSELKQGFESGSRVFRMRLNISNEWRFESIQSFHAILDRKDIKLYLTYYVRKFK